MEKKKRIVVTGASGMTGAALVLRLAAEGHEVVAYSRSSIPAFKQHPGIHWCPGNVSDRAMLDTAMTGAHEVYHLAAIATHWAPDHRDFYRTNVVGTIHVLEAARAAGVRRVVITSSVGVIGPPDVDNVHPINEDNIRTVAFFNDYETSKAIMHERVQDYVRAGMDIVLVLPSRVFGPGPIDAKNSVSYLLDRYRRKKMVMIPNTGDVIGNFVHVDDVVEGHILAMERGQTGERYFLGGYNLSMDELCETFHRFRNRPARVLHVPLFIVRAMAVVESGLAFFFNRHPMTTQRTVTRLKYHCPVDHSRATLALGYAPMSLDQALDQCWSWLNTSSHTWPALPTTQRSSSTSSPTLRS